MQYKIFIWKPIPHLSKIRVFSETGTNKWDSPTFNIPKQDCTIRCISDLRELNEFVIRQQCPLPMINDILPERNDYSYFTKVDISTQYYNFEFDEESKDLCTIVTLLDKSRYNKIPFGLK